MTYKGMNKPIILKIKGVLIIIMAILFAIVDFQLVLQWGKKGGHQAHPLIFLVDMYFVICGIGIIASRKWAIIAFAVPVTVLDICIIIGILRILPQSANPSFYSIVLLILLIPLGVVGVLLLNWKKCKW